LRAIAIVSTGRPR